MGRLVTVDAAMREAPDQQISLTDPDARSMATSGRGSGVVVVHGVSRELSKPTEIRLSELPHSTPRCCRRDSSTELTVRQ